MEGLKCREQNSGNKKTKFDSKYPINQSKNVKRFLPKDVKDYKQSKQLILNKEDYCVSSTWGSSRNIIQNSNCVNSQINKFKQTYSRIEPVVNKSRSVDVQNIQVIKNDDYSYYNTSERNSNSQKTSYSDQFPILYQALVRCNSNKPVMNKIQSVDVQNIQVINNNDHSHYNTSKRNFNSLKPLYSVHFPMLYEDLVRYNSNKILGPFLENLTEAEKNIYPPPLKIAVCLLCEGKPPKAILQWDLKNNVCGSQIINNIIGYEVAIIAVCNNKIIFNGWEQILAIKALPLPMTCTCKLVMVNNFVYYFAIRARGMDEKCGPFSISSPVIRL